MNEIIIAAITAITTIAGIIIGAVIGYYYFRRQERDVFNRELYTKYQELSKELAVILQDFLPLTLRYIHLDENICMKVDQDLSAFFFKNYLTLPMSVLEEICCMHVCLQSKGSKIYIVDKSKSIPLIRPCEEEQEVLEFFRGITIFRTRKNWAKTYITYKRVPKYITLRCQARHLIATMQDCWQYTDMHSWKEQMQKKTLAKLDIID